MFLSHMPELGPHCWFANIVLEKTFAAASVKMIVLSSENLPQTIIVPDFLVVYPVHPISLQLLLACLDATRPFPLDKLVK